MANQQPVWKTVLGCLVAPLALLLIPFIPLLNWLGWNKKNATPDYVVEYLETFIAGTEGEWDWDDFCSIPLADPQLEDIRKRTCDLGPWAGDEVDIAALQELLDEAHALQSNSN